MKNMITCLIVVVFFALPRVSAQNSQLKKDTIYFLFDTAAVPVKDRIFKIEPERPSMVYHIMCSCYPYATSIGFYYNLSSRRETKIKMKAARKIKTVSIIELIEIAMKCQDLNVRKKYEFIFLEPDGREMRLTKMFLGRPYKPQIVN